MDVGVRNTLFAIAAFISVVLGLLFASVLAPKPMTVEQMQRIGFYSFDQSRKISDFEMIDHLGNEVGLSDFEGKWTLVFFGFTTCPDICPTTLSLLSEALRDRDKPPQVVMVTVDGERDTPAKLSKYVPAFNPEFRGFVGTFDQTVILAEQLNVAFGKMPGREQGSYLMDHTASIIIIDPEARYSGFIKPPHRLEHIQSVLDYL